MTKGSRKRPREVRHSGVAARIGAATRDITPPVGIYARQWGAAEHDASEGVHRPLTANVMVLRKSKKAKPFALATLDGGWWQNLDDEAKLRGKLIGALDLDPARVLVAMSHTHAACSLCTDDAAKEGGRHIKPYLKQVRSALVEATEEALKSAVSGTLEWTTGRCGLAANRDLPDPDQDRDLCGFNPDAPADDTVLVGRATDKKGRILGTIVNYACHPTTLAWDNRLISPDYVGGMREIVEAHTDQAPCLFLQGASGDLGPREGFVGDPAVADKNGRYLGHAAVAALESMLPPRTALRYAGAVESGAPLAEWRHELIDPPTVLTAECVDIELPLKPMPSEEEVQEQLDACTDRVLTERLRRRLRLVRKLGSGSTAAVPTWFWRLGDAVLVAHPNECYSVLQTTLRDRFPRIALPVATLVNGGVSYVSPPQVHTRDLYQVWVSPFHRNAMPALLRESTAAIERVLGTE